MRGQQAAHDAPSVTERPGGTMNTRTAASAILLALVALTASCSGDTNDTTAPGPSASSAASASTEQLTPECRTWIEDELLDSSDSIDATAGVDVCGNLSDDEMDQAIEDVTNDLSSQGAAPADASEDEYTDGDYIVGEDIPAGTYTSDGAKPDEFLCIISTTPTSDSTFPQLESANVDEPIIITLSEGDGKVSIEGCEPLTPRQ